jgi:hypothetical protein
MPIYEFYCPNNHRIYSFFARSLAYAGKTPVCPDNPKYRMERMMSSFAVTGRAKESADLPPGGDMENPRMEAMMAEMEREMSGINEQNPDPRQLAGLMRKMSAVTGEKMPVPVEEMIRRMEAGEDPERIEEEMGSQLDDIGADEGGCGATEGETSVKARLRRLRGKPRRDPTLYEMSDFVK